MDTEVSLKQKVNEQLSWLFHELGFRIVEDNYQPKSFGNSYVILESSKLRVRFIRDRGQVSAEIASLSAPGTWWSLEQVCELIEKRTVEIDFELVSMAAMLHKHFDELAHYFGPNFSVTQSKLKQLAEDRKRAFLSRLSR